MTAYRIAVFAPVPEPLDYLSATPLSSGARVRVPLGNRTAIGVVLGVSTARPPEGIELKAITDVIDTQSIMPATWLNVIEWAAGYYGCRLETMLRTAMPTWGKSGRTIQTQVLAYKWQGPPPKGPTKQAIFEATQTPMAAAAVKAISASVTRQLIKEGCLVPAALPAQAAETGPDLMSEQATAIATIEADPKPWLLEGVTGSGKTEVYLRLAQSALAKGQQVLVLVPEIGLTPQLVRRFERRFPGQVVHLHSALADGARWKGWCQVAQGQVPILIGTRSALLTPMPNLGLIVIDEEHDGSYKQAEAPRYHARDLAVVIGHRYQIPVVMGSATPALESIANVDRGRFGWVKLTQRAGNAKPPVCQLIDLRSLSLHEGLSDQALEAIKATLQRGEQALVFLNRRGYAPILTCHQCGWHPECHHCDAKPTVHLEPRKLWCHHCDTQSIWPNRCPTCANPLQLLGHGTQRLEQALIRAMAPFPVTRIDRDTAGAGGAGKLLELARDNEPRVLVGTQMLAKGHDLPNLTLVVVVDSDSQLFSGDFRAIEHLGQTLIQVMGRAGRAEKLGQVLIQTHEPEHSAWPALLKGDYRSLAAQEMPVRERAGLPPFGHLALWRARDPEAGIALGHLNSIAQHMRGCPGIKLLGPSPAPMERRAGQYHAQLLVMADDRNALRAALSTPIPNQPRSCWRGLDMDPQDLF